MCQRIQKDTEFAENITPLRFPTTALTDLYDQTKDIKLTRAAAGHTTSAMTLKYYVKGQETSSEAAAAVDQLYAGSLVGSWNKENPLPVAMQRIAGFLAAKKLERQLENTPFFSNEVILAVTKFIEKFMNTKEKPPKSEDLSGFSWKGRLKSIFLISPSGHLHRAVLQHRSNCLVSNYV